MAEQEQMTAGTVAETQAPWLVVVDMQNIFGAPDSPWFTPRFSEIIAPIHSLIAFCEPTGLLHAVPGLV